MTTTSESFIQTYKKERTPAKFIKRRAIALGATALIALAGGLEVKDIRHDNNVREQLDHPIGVIKKELTTGQLSKNDVTIQYATKSDYAYNQAAHLTQGEGGDVRQLSEEFSAQHGNYIEKGAELVASKEDLP
ncbi:MAG: hypothetical protein NVS1B10_01290 [Candidatus Saccharimonadales bacterium]